MLNTLLVFCLGFVALSCELNANLEQKRNPLPVKTQVAEKDILNPEGNQINSRFSPPSNFERVSVSENSFANFLRNLPLKPNGDLVTYYDGSKKQNENVYLAVIDLPIGKKDLHQCADAVMRLRADYLYSQERYNEIHFNFTNGFRVDYEKYMAGNRMVVSGNTTYWKPSKPASNTLEDFIKYKELIFMYAGTLSLSRELVSVNINKMKIGDVFIQGGSPGHAVIVVDLAENQYGEKVFMLAQSYMPAQEIQVLQNPNAVGKSPWFNLKNQDYLQTPEWDFELKNLKRFPQ